MHERDAVQALGHPSTGQRSAFGVEDVEVVMVLGPVHSQKYQQCLFPLGSV
jgi:hypothetical protein